jgi:hypothetical protein
VDGCPVPDGPVGVPVPVGEGADAVGDGWEGPVTLAVGDGEGVGEDDGGGLGELDGGVGEDERLGLGVGRRVGGRDVDVPP